MQASPVAAQHLEAQASEVELLAAAWQPPDGLVPVRVHRTDGTLAPDDSSEDDTPSSDAPAPQPTSAQP